MKKNKSITISTILAALLMLTACSHKETEKAADNSIVISTSIAIDSTYIPVLENTGSIFASQEANLGSSLPGRVERILVPEGGHVQKGQLIVEMSDELMLQAQIEYETLLKDLGRVNTLLSKSTISQQEYDHVKARFDASAAKYNMLKRNTEIRAPFSGTVVKHMVKAGENYSFLPSLNPGYSMNSGIVSLMNLDPLTVKVDVNEKDINSIKVGQTAMIQINNQDVKEIKGTVTKIMPVLSTATRTATVEIRIANPNQQIKPGMYCTASFYLAPQHGVAIPRSSILRTPGTGDQYVFTIVDNKAHKQLINIEADLNDYCIVSGLDSEMTIAMEGKGKLSEGLSVSIKNGE